MKIKCTLGTIDQAVKQLKEYKKGLEKKNKIFLERLADIGIETATASFKSAEYDGTNDVVVDGTPQWHGDNKLVISASGQSILFIEFGTGVHYAAQSHPKAAEFGFTRGSYGSGLGRLDSWRYEGDPGTSGEVIPEGQKHAGMVRTHGNPANRSMYDASKAMREQIVEIAREVFRT